MEHENIHEHEGCCEHCHEHGEENRVAQIVHIALGAALLALGIAADHFGFIERIPTIAVFVISYLILGYDVALRAARNLLKLRPLDEAFLMTVATLGAFAIGELPEACAVMLFYQLGELLEDVAVDRSRESIIKLMDIRPDRATVLRGGEWVDADPDDVAIGDTILVKPGEKIPLDGVLTRGGTSLDTHALTGESIPRDVTEGDDILSGAVNLTSPIEIRVTKGFGDSTASKIIELVENAQAVKSRGESVISRFAKIYTPAVVAIAVAVALIPSIITGEWATWVYRGLVTLVISCPCALVVSVPLTYFAGLGTASRLGVLVKGSSYLEALSDLSVIALDKTGTLTKGVFEVSRISPADGVSETDLLRHAAAAERFSNHPIACSILRAAEREGAADERAVSDSREIAGRGVSAVHETDGLILAGNAALLEEHGIAVSSTGEHGTIVHVAAGGRYEGYILIADEIKGESSSFVSEMKKSGVSVVMLTGDAEGTAAAVADEVGIERYKAELLPAGKVSAIEEMIEDCRSHGGKLAFVGDGINDAPSLARADVGIGMGGIGSDAAIEAADAVLMTDDLGAIPRAIHVSRKVRRIIRENITLALAVKLALIVLSWLGKSSMWWAVFGDVGVLLIVIANSLRVTRK